MLGQCTEWCTVSRRTSLWLGLVVMTLFIIGCSSSQPAKVYRVGILSGADSFASAADGFKAKLTELGYVEGKNITYDVEKVNADSAAEQQILKKFVADKVDLIFGFPSDVAVAAKTATQGTNIPVLFDGTSIEGLDLIKDVREPGGNITGVRFPGPDRSAKRLELLLELAPNVKRVWLNCNYKYPTVAGALQAMRPIAASRGITLVEVPVTSPQDIKADLQARAKASDLGVDAVLIMPETVAQLPESWAAITQFVRDHKVPLAGNYGQQINQGALFTYIPDNTVAGALAAPLADKIFRGTPAREIPVVTADSVLQINYKVAQQLGLTVSEGLLKQATNIVR